VPDDKRDLRILIALIVAALGIGAAIFGVVRGLSATGPARGVRLQIAIAPPLDPDLVALATRVVQERCEEKGIDTRVVGGGDRVVAEVGDDDPEHIDALVALIERRAVLEVHQLDPSPDWHAALVRGPLPDGVQVEGNTVTAADGKERGDRVLAAYAGTIPAPADRQIAYGRRSSGRWAAYVLSPAPPFPAGSVSRAQVASGGVAITLRAPFAATVPHGVPLAFVLDGIVTTTARSDHAGERDIHIETAGATEDEALRKASELVTVIETGTVPALHVTERTPFSRATGFFPRAWPFFAICAALILVAAVIARRR
jgi:hypothetical protein